MSHTIGYQDMDSVQSSGDSTSRSSAGVGFAVPETVC